MVVFTKKDITFGFLAFFLVVCSIITPISLSSKIDDVMSENVSSKKVNKVVIDAGHGLPDGGAVSNDGVEESSLNLQIAKKLQDLLEDNGVEVIMTRNDENCIADSDKTSIKEIKVSDINNRIEIANNSRC